MCRAGGRRGRLQLDGDAAAGSQGRPEDVLRGVERGTRSDRVRMRPVDVTESDAVVGDLRVVRGLLQLAGCLGHVNGAVAWFCDAHVPTSLPCLARALRHRDRMPATYPG